MAARTITSFYGAAVPRPYVLFDKEGNTVPDRVDAPQVNEALIDWASKVPVQRGGTLVKPQWDPQDGPQVKEARTDFQIFFQEQFDDIHAANPAIFASDRRAMLAAASVHWRERLTPEQRAAYRERAVAEKAAVAARIAEAEEFNPKLKTFREKLQKYKTSVGNILSAAKVSAGPLWRVQRRLNANYRLLEEQEGAAEGSEGPSGRPASAKRGGKQGRGKAARGRKAAASKRLVHGSDSSSEEDEAGDVAAAADAAAAMQKLLLATAKKLAPAAAKKAGGSRAPSRGHSVAADADEQEASSDSGSEEVEEEDGQGVHGGRHTRSGAAVLAGRLGSRGRTAMYADTFELPPSQSVTPAKGRAASGGGRQAGAEQPAKSPGKRLRNTRHSVGAAAEAAVVESPAKKARRTVRK